MSTTAAPPGPETPLRQTSGGWFRVLYVGCIVALSLQAMHGAVSLRDHRAWLPAFEILGALLLLGRRLQRAGLAILLAVYLIAGVLTLHMGHLPVYLLLYAGAAIFLVRYDR
jgi:hypothetical protein